MNSWSEVLAEDAPRSVQNHCGSVPCSQRFKSFLRSVIVVVRYIRTPLASTWFASKSSLNRKDTRWKDLSWVVPICSVIFQSAVLVFWNTLICSDLLRCVSSTIKSEQIRETPFCRPLFKSPTQCLIFTCLSFHGVYSAIVSFVSLLQGLRVMRMRAHKTLTSHWRIQACG